MIYDLEVDTVLLSPEACAERISQHVLSNPPRALRQLQAQFGLS